MKKDEPETASLNTKMFNNIAHNYDFVNQIISLGLYKRWRKRAMKSIVTAPGVKILDLCCGTGDWTMLLAKKSNGQGIVTGLDLSSEMLHLCRKKSNKNKINNIKLIRADVISLPFENEVFDYITIGFGLRNVKDKNLALKEIYRVLKPKGTFICLETSIPNNYFVNRLFSFYFTKVMPVIGGAISRNFSAYKWLSRSTFEFYAPIELRKKISEHGFTSVNYEAYNGGLVSVYISSK